MSTGSGSGPLGFDGDDEEDGPGHSPARQAADEARAERAAGSGRVVSTSQYTWYVGIAAIVLVLVFAIGSFLNGDSANGKGLTTGEAAPPFAAPLVLTGAADKDANITRAGEKAACNVTVPDVVRSCDLWRDKPVVLAFFNASDDGCIDQVNRLAGLAAKDGRFGLAAIALGDDRGRQRSVVTEQGWRFPVGADRDGAVTENLYGFAPVCPAATFVRRGGSVASAHIGTLSTEALQARIREMLRPAPPAGTTTGG